MEIAELGKEYPLLSEALGIVGKSFSTLYPPQAEAIKKGVLDGKNLLMASGTGSGKTLIAELAAVSTVLGRGKKVIYIAPLRALAGEKFGEFRKYEKLGIKAALSIGRLDRQDSWLKSADIIVSTAEKFDSLMRHGAGWIEEIGAIVIDEIHEIGSNRGPTLESLIVKMRKKCPNLQTVALSATVGNADEMAQWLDAELVESDFRPVPLSEGVLFSNTLRFADEDRRVVSGFSAPELACLDDTMKQGFQSLIFLNTRRSAEATAERAGKVVAPFLKEGDGKKLAKLSKEVLNALDYPTRQCKRAAACIKNGTAFHHAGLAHSQKVAIEEAFREGTLRFIAATVTLVAGINMPARRIMIKNLSRYSSFGMEKWPVSLYKQAVGRAGRAGYDKVGESVVMASSESDAERILEEYIKGKPEDVVSQISNPATLRSLVIGILASGFAHDRKSLQEFFASSFHAHQNKKPQLDEVDGVVEDLIDWGFVAGDKRGTGFVNLGEISSRKKLELTPVGRRVAELYLDPLSASLIIQRFSRKASPLASLLAISDLSELGPMPSVRRSEEDSYWELADEAKEEFLQPVPEPWDDDASRFIRAVKMAKIFEAWAEEVGENGIMEEFGVSPGDLRRKLSNADWVLFGAGELAALLGRKEIAKELRKLHLRVKGGVKEELLKLVVLRDIGRKRARKLFRAGIKSKIDVKRAGITKVASVIGSGIARKVFKQFN